MKETINVALPKGRLGRKVYQMFADAGFECPELLEESRKLIFENEEKGQNERQNGKHKVKRICDDCYQKR